MPDRPRITCGASILTVLLAAILAGCGGTAGKPGADSRAADGGDRVPDAGLAPAERDSFLASFDVVWRTVLDKHWEPDLGGVDWTGAREELRPRVAAAQTRQEARAPMIELLDRLRQSHFGIIPAEAYAAIEGDLGDDEGADGDGGVDGDGDAGLELRVHEGRALVTFVHPEGTAAGRLQPGWLLDRVNGRSVDSLLARVSASLADAEHDAAHLNVLLNRTLHNLLAGDRGDTLSVVAIAAGADVIPVALPLGAAPGERMGLGNLPAQDVWFLQRRLPLHTDAVAGDGRTPDPAGIEGVGYIRFNFFLDPVRIMGAFQAAVAEYEDAAGLIIDLRGNFGGIGAMAMGVAGFLVDGPGQRLGTLKTRDMELNFVVNARRPHFAGPVAVLVDGLSMSTAEILAGGLQDLGRARVFGTPTPGAALPSIIARLPSGDGFQYAFANYVSAGGEALEGRGVTPDEVVPPDRDALLAGHDPVVRAAVEWIVRERQKG
ncbi:MAG: S41 family peptidase [Candidatus Krumholzibacteriia bacterium]